MAADIEAIVESTVIGLGFELVDLERTTRGLLRVFIDKPNGILVDDCADVSNHLTRVFMVEEIDFDRLEVSSPGLDRPLKKLADFHRFRGSAVKVKLNSMLEGRRRFEGVIDSVQEAGTDAGAGIVFHLVEDVVTNDKRAVGGKPPAKVKSLGSKVKSLADPAERKMIRVPLESIDKARLIPDI